MAPCELAMGHHKRELWAAGKFSESPVSKRNTYKKKKKQWNEHANFIYNIIPIWLDLCNANHS